MRSEGDNGDTASGELPQTLGTRDVASLVVGTVIGSGIFIVPATVAFNLGGSLTLTLLLWAVGGALSFLGAMTYAELGTMMPRAGGLYVFIREAAGPLVAFLYGWVLFLVIAAGTMAALGVAAVAYVERAIPPIPYLATIGPTVMIAGLTAVNVFSTRQSIAFTNVTTLLKVLLIVAIVAALLEGEILVSHRAPAVPASISPLSHLSAAGVGTAMLAVLWAYEGWQWVTFTGGELRNPRRAIPLGLLGGSAVVVVIYLLANLAFLKALGPRALSSSSVAADAARMILGRTAETVVAATIVLSIVSSANGTILTVPRVLLAMARDGVFFRAMGRVHPRHQTPALAVLAVGAMATLYALTGTFDQLLRYVVFTEWLFYGIGGIAVFILRRKWPRVSRPFRVPGYPVTPALFVGTAAAVVLNTILTQPRLAAVGLGAVATGIPVFYAWRLRQRNGR
jgi:APA family basic amino acid/polyamine antiporter